MKMAPYFGRNPDGSESACRPDGVDQSELAALREQNYLLRGCDIAYQEVWEKARDLGHSLTTAELRNSELIALLRESVQDDAEGPCYFGLELWGRIHAALCKNL